MSVARLRRKVRPDDDGIGHQAWLEDVLTSDVLGALRYLPVDIGLGPLLAEARNEHAWTLHDLCTELQTPGEVVARIRFWPRLADGKEPDALILLWPRARCDLFDPCILALTVEAKLLSGQHLVPSPNGPIPQIAHYVVQSISAGWADPTIRSCLPAPHRRALLYVTGDPSCPVDELCHARQAAASLMEPDGHQVPLFWLSWRRIATILDRSWRLHASSVADAPWLRHLLDARDLLHMRDLREPTIPAGIRRWSQPMPPAPFVPSLAVPESLARLGALPSVFDLDNREEEA